MSLPSGKVTVIFVFKVTADEFEIKESYCNLCLR